MTDSERFWLKVRKTRSCWLWLGKGRRGAKKGPQYGVFTLNGVNTTAHRAAYVLQRGPILPGICVLHKCDNPICVRGSHLWLGTRQDNQEDMRRKGRQSRGEQRPDAKMRAEDVTTIRARYHAGSSPTALAQEYGLHLRTIWNYIRRERWTHI